MVKEKEGGRRDRGVMDERWMKSLRFGIHITTCDQRGSARHGMVSTASGVVSRILFGVLDSCSSDGPRSLDLRVNAHVISNSRAYLVTPAAPASTRGGLKSSLAARAWWDTGCHFP